MLNGFANENMSQNRFMARTRQLNNSFSNAIGTKEVTPLTDIYKSVRKAPIGQLYANAIGSKKTSTILINPVGFAPYKCGSNNSCGQGHRCITNGTNVATGEVANWCVPFAEYERLIRQRAFDGGFANAIGTTKTLRTTPTSSPSRYPLPRCQGNTSTTYCLSCNALQGQNCPTEAGNYEVSNQAEYDFLTNSCGCSQLGTRPTSSRPTNISVKFDGGFNYVNGGFDYADGGCGDNGMLGL
jgi:hypothetical protein